jgi:AraC-like DNA-binding protein
VEEVARLLHPIAGKNIRFRLEVMRSVGKLQHPKEMAELFGVTPRTFNRQFRDEFNTSPYQYALHDKAGHVAFRLLEMKRPPLEVRSEFGFRFAGQFTRFCKDNFGDTPMHLFRKATGNTGGRKKKNDIII